METAIAVAAVNVAVLLVTALVLRSALVVCRPNELLVISGRSRRLPDGSTVGYRLVPGGRVLRIPMVEEVNRMSLQLIPVEAEVHNAYARGGVPLSVRVMAYVKVSSDPVLVYNAVERSLGMSHRQMGSVARQTLEGVLREFLAEVTPEEVSDDRLAMATRLGMTAEHDFAKLGLQLDALRILSVVDEKGYLEGLGRERLEAARRAAGAGAGVES